MVRGDQREAPGPDSRRGRSPSGGPAATWAGTLEADAITRLGDHVVPPGRLTYDRTVATSAPSSTGADHPPGFAADMAGPVTPPARGVGATKGAARGGQKLLGPIRTPTSLSDAVGNVGQRMVNQALKGQRPLSHLTAAERVEGAKFFRDVSGRTTGRFKDAAAEFNQLRADFLEGRTTEIPGSLPDFMARRGYGP